MATEELVSTTSVRSDHGEGNADDAEYEGFLERLQQRFETNTNNGALPLFVADVEELFPAWLASFEESQRQFHNCSSCRHFLRSYGGLVVIDELGNQRPALWDEEDAPALYKPAVEVVTRLVRRAKVLFPFFAKESVWGEPRTGIWRHMAVLPPVLVKHRNRLLSPNQAMAQKREDFGAVQRALAEFTVDHVTQAITLLRSETLYRSEKVLGAAEWLLRLHQARDAAKGKAARDNVVWLAVALAPDGFCHPRSSMIGSLLEDIAAGMAFSEVSQRFAKKMHPLQYQRPQAAPSAGNIAAAEAVIEKLGLERALHRRFARLDEIQTLWRPRAQISSEQGSDSGVFSHLKPKAKGKVAPMALPPIKITWEKFRRTVLPEVESLELGMPAYGSFSAFVTAEHADAPPILQWDLEEARNPVSWYLYHGGSLPSRWGLQTGASVAVTAIALQPNMWGDEKRFEHQGKGVLFVLAGARDQSKPSLCLFPEMLKSELHAVRSTIEAYSRSKTISGAEEASACGLIFQSSTTQGMRASALEGTLRVPATGQIYVIDRWD